MEKLTDRLRARTDHDGKPLYGYRQNVAQIRAEISILQEQMDQAGQESKNNGD